MFHSLAQASQRVASIFIEMLEQDRTCCINLFRIIGIVLFIQGSVVIGFNQERVTSPLSEKSTNDVKDFNFLCTSNDSLHYCLVKSPRNATYGPVKRGFSSSCANNTYSICLEIVDNECVVHFKTMDKTYVGEWSCITRLLDRDGQNSDAVIIVNRNIPFQEIIFDTFEIGTFLIGNSLKNPDFDIWSLFLIMIIFTAITTTLFVLRLSIPNYSIRKRIFSTS